MVVMSHACVNSSPTTSVVVVVHRVVVHWVGVAVGVSLVDVWQPQLQPPGLLRHVVRHAHSHLNVAFLVGPLLEFVRQFPPPPPPHQVPHHPLPLHRPPLLQQHQPSPPQHNQTFQNHVTLHQLLHVMLLHQRQRHVLLMYQAVTPHHSKRYHPTAPYHVV